MLCYSPKFGINTVFINTKQKPYAHLTFSFHTSEMQAIQRWLELLYSRTKHVLRQFQLPDFLRVQQCHFQMRPNYWVADLNEVILWKCNRHPTTAMPWIWLFKEHYLVIRALVREYRVALGYWETSSRKWTLLSTPNRKPSTSVGCVRCESPNPKTEHGYIYCYYWRVLV